MDEGYKKESKIKEHIGFVLLFLIIFVAGIILINDKENPVKDNVEISNVNATTNIDSSQETSNNNVKAASTETKPTKVNINTGSIEDLDTLPGIGAVTAQKIIDYRTKNGTFKAIQNIMDVSGIGEAKYTKIKELICIKKRTSLRRRSAGGCSCDGGLIPWCVAPVLGQPAADLLDLCVDPLDED